MAVFWKRAAHSAYDMFFLNEDGKWINPTVMIVNFDNIQYFAISMNVLTNIVYKCLMYV